RVDTRAGFPRVDPSEALRQPRMLAYEVWVLQVHEKLFCASSVRIGFEYRERKVHGDQITAHRVVELLPRRLRWPCGVARTTSAYRWGGRPQPSRHQREERRRSRGPQEGSSLHRSSSWQSPRESGYHSAQADAALAARAMPRS